jgi:hypothetical protein
VNWLISVILAKWVAEIRKITVPGPGQPGVREKRKLARSHLNGKKVGMRNWLSSQLLWGP